jgi:hypothetical protein
MGTASGCRSGTRPVMSCPNCGSWAVKADRSLGGRMVCGRCGQILGGQVIPLRRNSRRAGRSQRSLRSAGRLWWWLLGLVLGISGVLAALETPRSPWPAPARIPWGQRGDNSTAPERGRQNASQAGRDPIRSLL